MRALEAIDADIRALARPLHPGVAAVTQPGLIIAWKAAVTSWRASNPSGEERYALLTEEYAATEDELARRVARERAAEKSLATVGVPPLVQRGLRRLERKPAIDAVEAWLESSKPWLVVAGTTGTGKSIAAGHVLTRAMTRSASARWISSGRFATELGSFDGQAKAETFRHVEYLVVDDFGAEHMHAFAESVFFEVLAARHENEVRTIITTNLDNAALRQRLGSRLADRIAHACHFVTCAGESMRRKAS